MLHVGRRRPVFRVTGRVDSRDRVPTSCGAQISPVGSSLASRTISSRTLGSEKSSTVVPEVPEWPAHFRRLTPVSFENPGHPALLETP